MTESAITFDASERWLPIPGHEGLYEVSDHGRVRSVPHQSGRGVRGGRLASLFPYGRGRHLAAGLYVNGKNRTWYVHVLVMLAFVGPKPPGSCVRHGPGGKYDNRLVNLCYGTKEENEADKLRDGTLLRGEAAPWAKLTQADVDSIRSRYACGGTTMAVLAAEFGARSGTISKIVNGTRWCPVASSLPPRVTSELPEYVPDLVTALTDQEKWLPVPAWDGLYEVSDLGRVRSLRRRTVNGWRGGQILRQAPDGGGYLIVSLADAASRRKATPKVHRLVMAAFVGPPPAGQITRHGPNGKLDNRLVNLSYGTHQDNSDDQVRDGTKPYGETSYKAKLTWDAVDSIRSRFSSGESLKVLAADHGVTPANIRFIVTGKTWRRLNPI